MTTTLTILPDIGGRFLVQDWGDGGAVKTIDVSVVKPEPFTITITKADRAGGKSNKDIIREKLKELVEESIEVGMAKDINVMIEETIDSPPVKILREQDWMTAIKQRGHNSFQVVKIQKGDKSFNTRSFGKERVFKLSPADLVYDNTKYFEPDRDSLLKLKTGEEASCAFQYINQKFGKRKGFIKKAKNFETIKKLSTTDPPQFRNWITQYQKEYNLEALGLETQHAVVEVESFETELYNLDVLDIKHDTWTDDELYNSMSVIDIVRWCMWTGVSCYVIDYDGHYYLSYNHGQLSKNYTDGSNSKKFSIVLKVQNNHAYFVDDKNLKLSVSVGLTKYNMEDFEDVGAIRQEDSDSATGIPVKRVDEEEEDYITRLGEFIKEYRNDIYISPYFKVKELLSSGKISLDEQTCYQLRITDPSDYEKTREEIAERLYKRNPPPLPKDFLRDENKTYYLEARSLNGIVSILKHNYGISPSTMNGAYPHQIDRATYGKTKLMSRRCNVNQFADYQHQGLTYINNEYPKIGIRSLPTATTIAKEIFNKYYKDKLYWSMFNSNTKRVFFDAEIKADNRVIKETSDKDIFSIDLKRAYTNALDGSGEIPWGVYDGICQFKKYTGGFNPTYFYLVKELSNEYPFRGGKGLKLYHGCFLRHLLSSVSIQYYIEPIRVKEADYFKKFIEECNRFDEESGGLISSKILVNNFIGTMKNADKISNYKIYETESNTTLTRAFYSGSIVSNIDKNTDWNNDYRLNGDEPIRLMATPINQVNIQSAQPIRLQVIDTINERLYKLYLDYKVAFGRCPLAMVRTDALYIECEDNQVWAWNDIDRVPYNKEIYDFCKDNPILCDIENICPAASWEYSKTDTTQRSPLIRANKWRDVININKSWSMTGGAKALFNLINQSGGAHLNGEAGVGKSELTNYFGERFDENRKLYHWVKLIKKLTSFQPYAELEVWRDNNPCFAMKLAPTNKATNRIGGKTLNKGLGIPVIEIDLDDDANVPTNDEDPIGYFEKKIARLIGDGYKKPCFDYICIDEISMINGYFWSILLAIKHRAPRIKFLLCGDIKRQLPPVDEEFREFGNSYLIKELAGRTQVNLNWNFRNKLEGNILWTDWSINPQRFKEVDRKELTLINLCRYNKTRKKVIGLWNDAIRGFSKILTGEEGEDDGQTEEICYTFGTPLIASKSVAELKIAKNELWKVCGFTDEEIDLVYEDRKLTLPCGEVYETFYSGYAITIHKAQGDTYADPYTIWDWEKLSKDTQLNRKLRYTAQSRSKKPEKNIYYKL